MVWFPLNKYDVDIVHIQNSYNPIQNMQDHKTTTTQNIAKFNSKYNAAKLIVFLWKSRNSVEDICLAIRRIDKRMKTT